MGRVASAALAGAMALSATVALAQTPTPSPSRVRIEVPSCALGPFAGRAWLTLLRSEIETDGVDVVDVTAAPEGEDPALAVIRVEPATCREDAAEVTVTIDDLLTRKTVRRVVALDDIPAAGRPRALALAVAELLRASWAELALEDAPATNTPVPLPVRRAMLLRLRPAALAALPPTTPATLATPPAPRWWLGATVDVRTFPGQSGALLGGRAVATWIPSRSVPLRLRADLGAAFGTALSSHGEIDMRVATVALGALLGGGSDRVDFSLGPRVEVGWAWVEGRPLDAHYVGTSDSDVVLFASMTATLRVALSARWWAALDIAAGQTLSYVTVSADSERVAGLRGPMLSVGLGLGVALP